MVGNRHFVHGAAQFGDFRSHSNLEAESRTGDDHVPNDFAAKGFVARLNIRQIDVGGEVGQERKSLIGDVMVEVQDSGGLAHQESGSVDDVRVCDDFSDLPLSHIRRRR